jgi:glyoxylase-like metal-dependent hydrolase (beta-lactamase superfamily II)
VPDITPLDNHTWLLHGTVGGRPLHLPVLRGGDEFLLLDTGCSEHVESLIWPGLKTLGVTPSNLAWIVNTHPDTDHIGGNAQLKRWAPSATLACGVADRALVESNQAIIDRRYNQFRAEHNHCYPSEVIDHIRRDLGGDQRVDVCLEEGSGISLGDRTLHVLHLPGHSDGHIGLFDSASGTLFAGDAIHGAVYLNTSGEAALCPTYLDVAAYRKTIRAIRDLAPGTFVSCHWPVYCGAEVLAFCDESKRFVDRAERLILDRLKQSPATLTQLCKELGPSLGDWPTPVNHELCYAFAGHLVDLQSRGLIVGDAATPRSFQLAEGR